MQLIWEPVGVLEFLFIQRALSVRCPLIVSGFGFISACRGQPTIADVLYTVDYLQLTSANAVLSELSINIRYITCTRTHELTFTNCFEHGTHPIRKYRMNTRK